MKNNARSFLFAICVLLSTFIVSSCTEQSQMGVSVVEAIGTSPEYENYESANANLTNFLMTSDFKASKLRDVMIQGGYVSFDEIPQNKLQGIAEVSKYISLQQAHDVALDILNQKYGYLKMDEEILLEIQRVYGAKLSFKPELD